MAGKLNIALAGNPNSGKTTLFNLITGLNQKTGNFPGTTVEKKTGQVVLPSGLELSVTDLPGFYSMYPKGEDENVSVQAILSSIKEKKYDKILFVADASNLKRCLLLCTQLADLQLPVIVVMNMQDIAISKGYDLDLELLSRRLAMPVIPINARKRTGLKSLLEAISANQETPPTSYFPSNPAEKSLADAVFKVTAIKNYYANMLLSQHLSLLGNEKASMQMLISGLGFDARKHQAEDSMERYSRIEEILKTVQKRTKNTSSKEFSTKIDKILTHRIYGYFIFLLIFFTLFQSIFTLAQYPMNWIETLFAWVSNSLGDHLPKGIINDVVSNGIIPGLGGVIVFLPQIMILFAFLTVLEDTGYMARVSFIMDRIMRKFGLNGKSVVPLIGGMACAVASILATRTIENKKERLITIMATPFMSCSARLPVYTVLISLIADQKYILGFINLQGLILLGMYLLGIIATIVFSFILKILISETGKNYFIMELPVYKWPVWNNIYHSMIHKSKDFIGQAGKVIVAVSVVLWFLGSYGPKETFNEINKKFERLNFDSPDEKATQIASAKLEASYAGIFGKFIEPAIRPLGYDWKIGIALLSSLAAREVFIGTMSTIYGIGDQEDTKSLKEKLLLAKNSEGKPVYTVPVALSLMVFYAFALQCISTIAVTKRETGGWKWAIIQFLFMTFVAYFSSLITYQLLS
ncbi:MAG: ferrous iron transport protein B [Opitutaceae bacterium]|nr:ferrous iron transport protein B [Cytophagales bacterium]